MDVQAFVAIEHNEIDRLLDLLMQRAHKGVRRAAQWIASDDSSTEFAASQR